MDHKLFANGDVFNIFVVTFPQSFSRNITIRLFQLSVFQKNIHELNWPKWSIFWPREFFSAHLVKMAPLLRSKSLFCFVFLTKYYVTQYKSSSLKLHNNTKNTLTSRNKTLSACQLLALIHEDRSQNAIYESLLFHFCRLYYGVL